MVLTSRKLRRLRRLQLATSQPLATAASKIAVLGHSGATTAATATSKIAVLGHSGVTIAAGIRQLSRAGAPARARTVELQARRVCGAFVAATA